ncbi:MAG: SPW repeat domain-containing protein [Actinomycetota bacterium]
MSAIRLLPWALHQALAYAGGIFCIVAPFALGFAEGAPLAVFVGAGVALLLVGVLGKGGPGVAQILPATVHVALTYILGFVLLLAPFVFGFADEEIPLATAIFVGLAIVVITLIAAVPGAKRADDSAADTEGEPASTTSRGADGRREARAEAGETDTPGARGAQDDGDDQPPSST